MKKLLLLPILAFTISALSQIPTKGLVAYYPFNGNAIDGTLNGNNGTVNGATLTDDRFGNVNSAYNFDGTNSITLKYNSTLTPTGIDSLTYCFWMKTDNTSTNYGAVLFSNGNLDLYGGGFSFRFGSNNAISYWLNSYSSFGGGDSNSNILLGKNLWDNTFHFVTVSFLKGICSISVDGQLAGSDSWDLPIKPYDSNYDVQIGKAYNSYTGGFTNFFTGILDDIRIYNRGLTAAEIAALYNEGNIATGLHQAANKDIMQVYPNPVNDVLTIDCGNNYSNLKGYSIKIINSASQPVYESAITKRTETINLRNWAGKGVYLITLYDGKSNIKEVRKIIIP